jgi:hypothetical protein
MVERVMTDVEINRREALKADMEFAYNVGRRVEFENFDPRTLSAEDKARFERGVVGHGMTLWIMKARADAIYLAAAIIHEDVDTENRLRQIIRGNETVLTEVMEELE